MEQSTREMEPYSLHWDDLVTLSCAPVRRLAGEDSCSSSKEIARLEATRESVLRSVGPSGPGLVSVIGVPNASIMCRSLLPQARELALLEPQHCRCILKKHNLGSDVRLKNPSRKVSSFAMQLNFEGEDGGDLEPVCSQECHDDDPEFSHLSGNIKKLGYCMMIVGLYLAKLCDNTFGNQELHQSIIESGSAKSRLIHYHSAQEVSGLQQTRTNRNAKHSSFWQEWHYDYGLFTVLVPPMFLAPMNGRVEELPPPNGQSCLQIIDGTNVLQVKHPAEGFIIQVGEAAHILSKGKLQATLHCVKRPTYTGFDMVCREMFVVFLQPAWHKVLRALNYDTDHPDDSHGEICKDVPSLSSRLKDGMTYAEFAHETTRQYYGVAGSQPNY